MIAWGFELGFKEGHLTPVQFATKAASMGYRWAALELDDYDNAERWGPFHHACTAAGIRPGPWFTEARVELTPADAHFVIAEVESEEDRVHAIDGAPGIPATVKRRAVLTNFTPMTDGQGVPQPDKAKPLIDAGYDCLTECYMGESNGASLNPESMNFRATVQLGWPRSQPVFGVYNKPLPEYATQIQNWPAYGLYLAEYVL
jgi:hypothetical protein